MKFPLSIDTAGRRVMGVRPGPGFGLAVVLGVAAHGFAGWVLGGGGDAGFIRTAASHESDTRPAPMLARMLTAPAPPAAPLATRVLPEQPAPERISKPATLEAKAAATKAKPPEAAQAASSSADPYAAWQELVVLPPVQYLPTHELEIPPLPRSAPDPTVLQGAVSSGLPIRLRLFIDELGVVANIEVLQASELDDDAVARMKRMFYDTRFLAGRRASEDVASFMDIEVSLAELM